MKSTFRSLSHALGHLQFGLSRDGAARIMVAAPTLAAMRRGVLPEHVTITPNKRRGPRVVARKAQLMDGGRTEIAIWPEAGISEYTLPVLGCVISGQADLRVADYIMHCQPGDMILFPAGIPKCNSQKSHLEGNSDGRSCDVLWINKIIPAMGLGCYICQSRGAQHVSLQDQTCLVPDFFLEQLFEKCCEELLERGSSKIATGTLSLIIALFKRAIDENTAQSLPYANTLSHAASDASHDPIDQACLYIDSHLKLHLTIENVARHVYLSTTQFTRSFRAHTGQTFHQYLTNQRLKKASQLLRETNATVQVICGYVGIKPNQLRNLFQKEYGCSPKTFRHRHHASSQQ